MSRRPTRCCPRSASSSVARPPRSTRRCSRCWAATSAGSTATCARRALAANCWWCKATAAWCRARPRSTCRGAPRWQARRRGGAREGGGRGALSGPAGGVIACASIARAAGFPDAITGDMGGTSFDVSLVADGQAALAPQSAIEFGMVIRSPMIQIETIGAGGGSIASVDASGMLQVGPESVGSVPGPACYGRGGMYATVTDANLLLGRIAAERPLRPPLLPPLDAQTSRQAIEEHVARPLALDVHAAAEAFLTVANARMAGAIRLVSIERGHDPRRFAYMPFGGGGALHVCAMMREVGVAMGIVPRYPGVTSALGCVIADMRHDAVQTINQPLSDLDATDLRRRIDEL